MTRAKVLRTGHLLARISTAAELDADLFRLAATSTVYEPAAPTPDDPSEWRRLSPSVPAPHRCRRCGDQIHVRRHLEAHTCVGMIGG